MKLPTDIAKQPGIIYIVDDDLEDVRLLKRTFSKDGPDLELVHFQNGQELVNHLDRIGLDESVASPDLILLDLNMPILGGREALSWIRQDPRFMKTPVVVLSSSNSAIDIDTSYEEGANSYVVKPENLEGFRSAAQRIEEYWFRFVHLPRKKFI